MDAEAPREEIRGRHNEDMIKEAKEQEGLSTNPLDILTRAVEDNQRVLINCRDDRMLLGRVRAFC